LFWFALELGRILLELFRICYVHREGNGINSVATGLSSGQYTVHIRAATVKEAVQEFNACYRHGNTLLKIDHLKNEDQTWTKMSRPSGRVD
jgi:hypothetical protein